MTPTDCLKAGPAELAPIVAEMLKGEVYLLQSGGAVILTDDRRSIEMSMEPWEDHADAFRLQERVAELKLAHRFGNWLYCVVTDHGEAADSMGMVGYLLDYGYDKWDFLFTIATASPLNRTRACVAAYLESKETKQ